MEKHDPEMIEFLGYDSETGGTSPVPGAQVYRAYKFKALKIGETKITLTYGQTKEHGFARDDIWKTLEVPVTIQ
jgi:predicted secreted protein